MAKVDERVRATARIDAKGLGAGGFIGIGDPGAVLEALPDAVIATSDDGHPFYANARARALFGSSPAAIASALGVDVARGRPAAIRAGDALFEAAWARHGSGWLACLRDATARDAERREDRSRALADPLTGLPNRAALLDALGASLEECGAIGADCGLLLVDLDKFKPVNDTLGHAVGDALLKAVAKRLLAAVREGDGVFRLGGDEFAILVPCPDPAASDTLATCDAIARRTVELLGRPFLIDGHMVGIGASVGIAVSEGSRDADELLKRSDIALYRAKKEGRGRHVHFAAGMDEAMRERRQLEIDLRRGIALQQFELHYQPQFDLSRGVVTGFEALVRWNHPERGLTPPVAFVPVAEESGLIVPLGEWVLRSACRAAASWSEPVSVSVNVSPAQFAAGNLIETVAEALRRARLPASRLVVEITESVLMQDDADTVATLHGLKELGVRVAMDDFGTGYSSLSYLRSFPFDIVKVDQCFVRGDGDRSRMEAIVRAVAALGQSIGMTITAEGVETMEQLEAIQRDGCGSAQGYLIGRPMPEAMLSGFFEGAAEAFDTDGPAAQVPEAGPVDVPATSMPARKAPRAALAPPPMDEPSEGADGPVGTLEAGTPTAEAASIEPPAAGGSAATLLDDLAREVRAGAPGEFTIAPAPRTAKHPTPPVEASVTDPGATARDADEGTLHRLVYRSLCAIHDTEASLIAEVDAILEVARRKNAEAGVTGALMFNGTHYSQVLEGPREAVERIFEAIQLDPRHSDVVLLGFDPVGARLFANWSMAHVGATEGRLAELAGLTGFDGDALSGDAMAARLHEVLTEEYETA